MPCISISHNRARQATVKAANIERKNNRKTTQLAKKQQKARQSAENRVVKKHQAHRAKSQATRTKVLKAQAKISARAAKIASRTATKAAKAQAKTLKAQNKTAAKAAKTQAKTQAISAKAQAKAEAIKSKTAAKSAAAQAKSEARAAAEAAKAEAQATKSAARAASVQNFKKSLKKPVDDLKTSLASAKSARKAVAKARQEARKTAAEARKARQEAEAHRKSLQKSMVESKTSQKNTQNSKTAQNSDQNLTAKPSATASDAARAAKISGAGVQTSLKIAHPPRDVTSFNIPGTAPTPAPQTGNYYQPSVNPQPIYTPEVNTSAYIPTAIYSAPPRTSVYTPQPPLKPLRRTAFMTREDLINAESRLGSTIFGPVPAGHRREFFHDQANIWIWFESWHDEFDRPRQLTIRYEVRTSGVYKKISAGAYFKLAGEELENFRRATHAYLHLVKKYLYPTTFTAK